MGSSHQFDWETTLTSDWMVQRVLEKIERLEEMPPPHLLTRGADDAGVRDSVDQ